MADKLSKFHHSFLSALQDIYEDNDYPSFFENALKNGDGKIYQKNITETKTFDEEWINTVESYFPSLNKIIKNPKSTLRYDEEVVPVEKARKITSQTIKHLSANTQNIREVTEDDEVIPTKLLTQRPELEYQTYENRFIMTLIDRLFQFVRKRLEIIEEQVESFQKKHFNLKTTFPIQKTEISLNIDVLIKEDLDDESINEYNLKLLERVKHLSKLVTSLKGGEFAENMKNYKRVYAPIMKTSIILKNVDYRNAYLLWLFLDRYNTLTFDLEVLETDLTFDDPYVNDLYKMALVTYSTIQINQEKRKVYYNELPKTKTLKPGLEPTTINPDDIILDPEDIEVEDTKINEYYLEQSKRLFKKSLEEHEKNAKTYETSLKRALRDTIEFSNALYKSFFELEEDDDIFRRLVKDKDSSEALTKAKEQALIAKMIREVKEVDYNNAIRLEKRLLKKIQSLDKKLIDEKNKRILTTAKKIKSEAKLRSEKEDAKQKEQLLDKKLALVKENKSNLADYRKNVNQEILDLQKRLDDEYKESLKAYEAALRKERNERLRAYKLENRELEKTYAKYLDNERTRIDERSERDMQRIADKELRLYEKERMRLDKEYNKKIVIKSTTPQERPKSIVVAKPKKLIDADNFKKSRPRRVERKLSEQAKQLLEVYNEKLK